LVAVAITVAFEVLVANAVVSYDQKAYSKPNVYGDCYTQCKQKMTSFMGHSWWVKMTSTRGIGGQGNGTGVPPEQKVSKGKELTHEQTLGNRTKLGPSSQLQMLACIHIDEYMYIIETA
jgi:hypothetical protein